MRISDVLSLLSSATVTASALIALGAALCRPLRRRLSAWLHGRDGEVMKALDALSVKVDENERDRLKQELFRYGNLARRGEKISGEEFRYLQTCFGKYTRLGGNGIAHDEYGFVRDYYNRKEWEE